MPRTGDYDDALKDFNSMGLEDVKPLDGKHKGFTGTVKDGTTVTVRDGSRGRVSKKVKLLCSIIHYQDRKQK
jgi:hypothetical protein